MKATIHIEFDEQKADEYNATLYEPPEDPVVGTGKTLIEDVLRDSPSDLIFPDDTWNGIILSNRVYLDGELVREWRP